MTRRGWLVVAVWLIGIAVVIVGLLMLMQAHTTIRNVG